MRRVPTLEVGGRMPTPASRVPRAIAAVLLPGVLATFAATGQAGDCPEEPPLQNFDGPGQVTCPCFVPGEQAGAVLMPPADHLPIEVLRVGVGWGSQFGGAPQSLEAAIHVYEDGLPDPGQPIASLEGPVLTDGFVNEFDLEPLPGEIVVQDGPFAVTLEFLNQNSGNIFAPSVVHDGNGCQPGKNAVFAIPGGWSDACLLGVTGDWVFYVIYRQVNCDPIGIADELLVASVPVALVTAQPNPFRSSTEIEFFIERARHVDVGVYDLLGRKVVQLADRHFDAGNHRIAWDGTGSDGGSVANGVYFVHLEAGTDRATRKILVSR